MATADGTKVYIGRCVVCRKTYRSETKSLWCTCRADNGCTNWMCAPYDPNRDYGDPIKPHSHPCTAIKWAPLKGTVSNRKCNQDCTFATSDKCSCSCGGRNHGAEWAAKK